MTIALAFDCANGAVLCADTQMTSDGGFKFEDSKILDAAQSYGWGIWGTYAGNPQLAQSVQSQLYDQLMEFDGKGKRAPNYQQFERLLQKTLNRVCGKGRGLLQMIWAFSDQDHVHLYRTDRRTINDVADFECLGVGDCSLVRFLAENLTHIPVASGMKAAYYIASQAMKYVDGVGGSIEILGIYPGGRMRWLRPARNVGLPSWSIHKLTEKIRVPRMTKKQKKYQQEYESRRK